MIYDLILELYSEEIPASMQRHCETAFQNIFTKNFKSSGIGFTNLKIYTSPCRIVLHALLNSKLLPSRITEYKGPRVEANESAIAGFCRSRSISAKDLETKTINGQQFYVYNHIIPALQIKDILPEVITSSIKEYVWPKSMKWGNSEINWVRPLRNILCLLDNNELKINFGHLSSNNKTFGHKFINPKSFTVHSWQEYTDFLENNFIVLDRTKRKSIILNALEDICKKLNVSLNYNDKLLDEVIGLVEYPNVFWGKIPDKFMSLPKEIIITSVQKHQKYFTVQNNENTLAPYFLFIANVNPKDPTNIITGNEKVLSSRLADALYFFEQDCKFSLYSRLDRLKEIVFHSKVGSVFDKVQRIKAICNELAPNDQDLSIAAELCKSDLVSKVVVEFPELQGIMGKYYALNDMLSAEIAELIEKHYFPIGVNGEIPTKKAAILALADKIDNLSSLYLARERATGSKDPFALRRCALAIVKIILVNSIEVKLLDLLNFIYKFHNTKNTIISTTDLSIEVLSFIKDKAKHILKEKFNNSLVEAIFDQNKKDNLVKLEYELHVLSNFLNSEKGKLFIQAYKRAYNIIKNDNTIIDNKIDIHQLKTRYEVRLHIHAQEIKKALSTQKIKDYNQVIKLLLPMTIAIDDFLNYVIVNNPNNKIANDRKLILKNLVEQCNNIAPFNLVIDHYHE